MEYLSIALLVISAGSMLVLCWEMGAAWRLLRREFPPPARWPSFSILKPMAGNDDELEENLESHARLEYPGEWELVLGVRSEADAAYPVAKAFVEKYPQRARLVLQEGEPGLNPKVNQLLTLTRHAKGEVIAVTDSNVRVKPWLLTEHAGALAQPGVGLTTSCFAGQGEQTVGAAFENMTAISHTVANCATGELSFNLTQIVGKCLAIPRTALEQIGGWESVKDLLAEDQRMGIALVKAGYRTVMTRTPVHSVVMRQRVAQFVDRQSRWAMIRFRVLPGVWLEPFLFPLLWALLGLACAPGWWVAQAFVGVAALASITFTQVLARMARGSAFPWKYAVLIPVRDLVFLYAWAKGRFRDTVSWRGNVLTVGANTSLSRG